MKAGAARIALTGRFGEFKVRFSLDKKIRTAIIDPARSI
jgi:hypothetical protein